MRDYASEFTAAAESTVKAPEVVPYGRFPSCPKCAYRLGGVLYLTRAFMSCIGRSAQRVVFCQGDHDSTVKVEALGFSTEMPVACFGIFSPHLHLICGCCGFRWLMECAPAPVSRSWMYYAVQSLKWFFILVGIFSVLLLCASEMEGQAIPESTTGDVIFAAMAQPATKPHLTRADWSLFAADEGARGFDAFSTDRALRCACNREVNIPAIAAHPPALWAYSLAVPVANLGLAALLEHHHHSRLAKLPFLIDIGYDLPLGVHNMTRQTATRAGFRRLIP